MTLKTWVKKIEQRVRDLSRTTSKGQAAAYHGTSLEFIGLYKDQMVEIVREFSQDLPASWEECADALMSSPVFDVRVIGLVLAIKYQKKFSRSHWSLFTKWLKNSEGWAMIDTISCDLLAPVIVKHPELVAKTVPWRTSRNLWLRRASLIIFCAPIREGRFAEEAFSAAHALAADFDPMIVKAESWILRNSIKHFRKQVIEFLQEHEDVLGKQALREVRTKLKTGRKTG